MRTIKLMADYQCYPLWDASPQAYGNIDPAELPISPPLRTRLEQWADAFDRTLNRADPEASGFSSPEEAAKFRRAGSALANDLKRELGQKFSVIAFAKHVDAGESTTTLEDASEQSAAKSQVSSSTTAKQVGAELPTTGRVQQQGKGKGAG